MTAELHLVTRCETCGGEGSYVVQSSRGDFETDTLPCPNCNGDGGSVEVLDPAGLVRIVDPSDGQFMMTLPVSWFIDALTDGRPR